MNYNIDLSVLAQALRNGVSQEEIAKSFATALNEASAIIKAEKAKKEEEARKAAENEKKKLQHAQMVADFYNTYYPEMFPGKDKATAETIIKACDSIKKIAVSTQDFVNKLDPKNTATIDFSRIFGI